MTYQIIKSIAQGKSLVRTLMNWELKKYAISGKVMDIGGGENPSYYHFLKKESGMEIINIDARHLDIDLEKDQLPAETESVDYVLMFNILEHIYNHGFLTSEAFRVLKKDGKVLGFVPFLINYHPDPHDYFRYTNEALAKIFAAAGFKETRIKIIGRGPWAVNFNNLVTLLPRAVSAVIFPVYYFFDWCLIKIKPKITERYPLGYLFLLTK